jgi:glycogen synthase
MQIDAVDRVLERWPRAGLIIAGSGSLEGALREHIARKTYGGSVLLAGDVPHAVALELIGRASAFLRTTKYDGDALSVREALTLGVPAIATTTRLRPPGTVPIPIDDQSALEEAVLTTVANRVRPSRSGKTITDESNLAAVEQIYERLAARAGRRG